jgi:hypothetical protein
MFGGSENPLREIMMRLFPLPDFLSNTKAQSWIPPWESWEAPKPTPTPSPKGGRGESYYRDKLAVAEGGEIEVSIPGGRIETGCTLSAKFRFTVPIFQDTESASTSLAS